MDSAQSMLASLHRRGVRLWLDAGQLRYQAAKGVLSAQDLADLRLRKDQLIEYLTGEQDVPLLPRPVGASAPLTATQLRWWSYINDTQRGFSERLCRLAVRVHGNLQESLLRSSTAALIQRHESLRTRIIMEGDSPRQVVSTNFHCDIEVIELSHLPRAEAEARALQLGATFVTQEFSIAEGPLFALQLYKVAEHEFVLIFALDHIITDGASNAILHRELWTCYAQAAQGRECSLPAAPIQYADYAIWQDRSYPRWLQTYAAYWREHLGDAPEPVFAFDHTSNDLTPSHQRIELAFGCELSDSMRELARAYRSLLAVVMLTIYVALMSRWCQQRDLLLQFVSDGRFRPELTNLVGFMSNCLHLRVQVDEHESILELLERVTAELRSAYEHRDFDRVPYLIPECRTDIGFNWMPTKWMWEPVPGLLEYAGLRLEPFPLEVVWRRAFLPMFMDTPEGILVSVTYRADLFRMSTIERWLQDLKQLAERIATDPGTQLSCLLSGVQRFIEPQSNPESQN